MEICNFNKALGPDWLSGKTLVQDKKVKETFTDWMLEIMNGRRKAPDYLSSCRLTLISKTSKAELAVENTRPILISSHITKIYERAIQSKLESLGSKLFNVPDY